MELLIVVVVLLIVCAVLVRMCNSECVMTMMVVVCGGVTGNWQKDKQQQ